MVEEDKDVLASVLDDQSGREGSKRWFDELSENQLAKIKEIILRYLSPNEQQIYHLKEEEGLSCNKISQRLSQGKSRKLSVAAVQKMRQRYREKIIEALEIEKYNKSGK
jgi:hypothetical protein